MNLLKSFLGLSSSGAALSMSRYWVGGTGSWDQATTTHWSLTSGGAGGASVPTAAHDVIFDDNSGTGTCTVTLDAPCRSLRSNTVGHVSTLKTLTQNAGVTISIGYSSPGAGNIALELGGFTTYNKGSLASILAFVSTSSTQQTIDYGGLLVSSQTFNGVGGSWQLLSSMTKHSASSQTLLLTAGALDTNGQAVSMAVVNISGTTARSLTLGTSTVSLSSNNSGAWEAGTTTNLTFSGLSSTITFTGSSTSSFHGGGLSYGTVNMTGTGTVGLTGANHFVNFTRSNAAACGLVLPSGVTQTVTGTWQTSGAAGAVMTGTASTPGSAATVALPSATCDYMSLKDWAATGAGPFHAGANSSFVSGVTGWVIP